MTLLPRQKVIRGNITGYVRSVCKRNLAPKLTHLGDAVASYQLRAVRQTQFHLVAKAGSVSEFQKIIGSGARDHDTIA